MGLPQVEVGIIGGSGFEVDDFVEGERVAVGKTPFGRPSDDYVIGELGGVGVAILNRHGRFHNTPPHKIPAQANIFGFKKLGVEKLIAVSAVGSLQPHIAPQDLVVPDQLVDDTVRGQRTFFDDIAVHVAFAEPFCSDLRTNLITAARDTGATVHPTGTYVCMEGPQFSTQEESRHNQRQRRVVIGMTASPEAKLAREAEMCYAILALSTDRDAWAKEAVTAQMVSTNMQVNIERAKETLRKLVPVLGLGSRAVACSCQQALDGAIMTKPEGISSKHRRQLAPLIGEYFPAPSRRLNYFGRITHAKPPQRTN